MKSWEELQPIFFNLVRRKEIRSGSWKEDIESWRKMTNRSIHVFFVVIVEFLE